MEDISAPTFTINFKDEINIIEICGTDFANNLMCIGFQKHLILGIITFPEDKDIFQWEQLIQFNIEEACSALCFSPETSLVTIPKNIMFCAGHLDNSLRVYRTDTNRLETIQILEGHKSYINDVSWVCDGEFLASVSDDQTCKIWCVSSNYKNVTTFCMTSAGMSVKWHPEDQNKILIAEKRGIIYLYNVRAQQAIVSVESPSQPLLSADWATSNRLYISALAAGNIYIWDLSRPFTPAHVKPVHEDGGRILRFSPSSSELVVASIGRPSFTLKVFSAKSSVPLIETSLIQYGGLAWHHRLPYVAAGADHMLHFWKVQMK